MNHFSYLLKKIEESDITEKPFEFILIENFLNQNDFENIIKLPQINLPNSNDSKELFHNLSLNGWQHISHPGTLSNTNEYLRWRSKNNNINTLKGLCGDAAQKDLCEGAGFALRLKILPPILKELVDFFKSKEFIEVCKKKFSFKGNSNSWRLDSGLQKYLHGYEISPHPDIREKALTWMLNLNQIGKEQETFHTQFLKFKKEKNYIYDLWEYHPMIQRQWVPWHWTENVYQQNQNNSITFFSPSNKSLHAIKAYYYDLNVQRTQLYGNIFYEDIFDPTFKSNFASSSWRDLVYSPKGPKQSTIMQFKTYLKQKVKLLLKQRGIKLNVQKR